MKEAKKNYYCQEISSQKFNPKRAWRSINNLLGKQNKQTVVNELKIGQENLNDPKDIAKAFNKYFSNIGPNLASKILSTSDNFRFILKQPDQSFLHLHMSQLHMSTIEKTI